MLSQTSFNLEDENILIKKRRKQLNLLMFISLFFIIGIGIFYVVYKYLNSISYNLFLEFSIIEIVCGIIIVLMLSKHYVNINKDLQEKIKNIYVGKITDKKEETTENSSSFFISLENEMFGVDKDVYAKFNIGDDIILEQAKSSKLILSIAKNIMVNYERN